MKCEVCEKPGTKCMQCHSVYYCCKEHQIDDWKDHKTQCSVLLRPFEGIRFKYGTPSFKDWELLPTSPQTLYRRDISFQDLLAEFRAQKVTIVDNQYFTMLIALAHVNPDAAFVIYDPTRTGNLIFELVFDDFPVFWFGFYDKDAGNGCGSWLIPDGKKYLSFATNGAHRDRLFGWWRSLFVDQVKRNVPLSNEKNQFYLLPHGDMDNPVRWTSQLSQTELATWVTHTLALPKAPSRPKEPKAKSARQEHTGSRSSPTGHEAAPLSYRDALLGQPGSPPPCEQ